MYKRKGWGFFCKWNWHGKVTNTEIWKYDLVSSLVIPASLIKSCSSQLQMQYSHGHNENFLLAYLL